jgi:hypothetical protein
MISRNQSTTCISTSAGAWSKSAALGFITEARKSASTPTGAPDPCTQPQKRGEILPVE